MHYWSFNNKDWIYNCRLYDVRGKYAYVAMLALYMDREAPLPSDVAWIARHIELPGEIELVQQVLDDHYRETKKGWTMPYAEEQLGKINSKRERAQNAAEHRSKSARDKRYQRTEIGTNIGTEIGGNAATKIGTDLGNYPITHEPNNPVTQKPRKPITQKSNKPETHENNAPAGAASAEPSRPSSSTVNRPDDVDEGVWRDWLRARGKAPLTATAWAAMCRESERAGISPGEAVKVCAERGWRGFRSDWLERDKVVSMRGGRKEYDLNAMKFEPVYTADGEVSTNPADYW